MCRVYFIWIFAAILLCATLAIAQSQNDSTPATERRCYHFTWLGPSFTNESIFRNASCLSNTRLTNEIPCNDPLVVSEDGTWPDVDYIWQNHRQAASCVAEENDICAQYTFYYNGMAENSTYMCTRANDNYGQAITRGCYQMVTGSHVTRVCFCQSIRGAMPCNNSFSLTVSICILLGALAVALQEYY